MPSGSRGSALESGLLHRFARHNPLLGIKKSVFSSAARPRQCGSRKSATRAGGLKTCWTKPQGTPVPQLWALQPGEELRGAAKTVADGEDRRLERTR